MENYKVNNNFAFVEHTGAVQSVSIQLVPYITAADKATNSIGTDLFTTSIDSITLIDVWKLKETRKVVTLLNTSSIYASALPRHLTPASRESSQLGSPRGVKYLHSKRVVSDPEQSSRSRKVGPIPGSKRNATASILQARHYYKLIHLCSKSPYSLNNMSG